MKHADRLPMNNIPENRKLTVVSALAILTPAFFLWLFSQPGLIDTVSRILLVVSVLFLSWLLASRTSPGEANENGSQISLLVASIFILGLCLYFDEALFGWLFLVAFYTLLILISESLTNQPVWFKWFGRAILTGSAGVFPVLINQILLRFSEEEFFTAIFMLIFSIFWLLIWFVYCSFIYKIPRKINLHQYPSVQISPKLWVSFISVLMFLLTVYSVQIYQDSFYPRTIEQPFLQISESQPFICETLAETEPSEVITGKSVQERYAQMIASKDRLTSIDYGFLATYYQTDFYISLFKEHLLQDAKAGLYTTPAGSVKWGQWEAAQALYYYLKVLELRPALFDSQQSSLLDDWITAINKRAQQVEWVDWMYGVAFSHQPVGAYLNQDIGAGLYSILNLTPNLEEALKDRNSNFLSENDRGWMKGFRVTDDAISYQPVWITNSFFQSLSSNQNKTVNQRLSFEWIKAQALPNGDIQAYNFPEKISIAPVALFGSHLLEDSSLLWLANTSLNTVGETATLPVQVGAERKIPENLVAIAPDLGSCLLYGDSGLPEQIGPLAPDKIVFRNGWAEDDLYILLNLRFTGWHRYKASNSISLIYSGNPLAEEQHTSESISWLPVGRALVRDKRIPIEQLNTLLIPRTGLDAVLNSLASMFGPYSQDPPFYANVLEFDASDSYDYSLTQIKDWHGWTFNRSIHFFQDGPVFVIDMATNKKSQSSKIRWHLNPDYQMANNRFRAQGGNVDFLLIGQDQGMITPVRKANELLVEYESPPTGELELLTIILPGALKDANFLSYSGNSISLDLDGTVISYEIKP